MGTARVGGGFSATLTSFAAWFGNAPRAASKSGRCTCRGGRQAFGSLSPAQVSAALGHNGPLQTHLTRQAREQEPLPN